MKVAVISDLHSDMHPHGSEMVSILAEEVNRLGADVLLIAGDVSEYYRRTKNFINELQQITQAKVYFCLGNHDLWNKHEKGLSVPQLVARLRTGEEACEGFLHNDAVELSDDVVLVAGCAWYDFTFAEQGMFTMEDFERQEYMGRPWRSKYLTNHAGLSDIEVTNRWNDELAALVRKYPDKKVILMTHMVNHPAFLVQPGHPKYELFRYFNGLLGNAGLYELTKEENVVVAISGHVHFCNSFREDGTYYMCRCLGSYHEFHQLDGEGDEDKSSADFLRKQIARTLEVIEL